MLCWLIGDTKVSVVRAIAGPVRIYRVRMTHNTQSVAHVLRFQAKLFVEKISTHIHAILFSTINFAIHLHV